VAIWLKSKRRNFSAVRHELKEVFSSATAATKTAPKEQTAAVASEAKCSTSYSRNWQLFASSNAIVSGIEPDFVSLRGCAIFGIR
jgi:hypothetical protein